jgi:hypothetical protein
MNSIIGSIILYVLEIRGPSLLNSNWACIKRVQTLLLHCIIECKRIVPQHIVQAELVACPFRTETIFRLVELLHHLCKFIDSAVGRDRYPYLGYLFGRLQCRYSYVSYFLQSVGISIDHIPMLCILWMLLATSCLVSRR